MPLKPRDSLQQGIAHAGDKGLTEFSAKIDPLVCGSKNGNGGPSSTPPGARKWTHDQNPHADARLGPEADVVRTPERSVSPASCGCACLRVLGSAIITWAVERFRKPPYTRGFRRAAGPPLAVRGAQAHHRLERHAAVRRLTTTSAGRNPLFRRRHSKLPRGSGYHPTTAARRTSARGGTKGQRQRTTKTPLVCPYQRLK